MLGLTQSRPEEISAVATTQPDTELSPTASTALLRTTLDTLGRVGAAFRDLAANSIGGASGRTIGAMALGFAAVAFSAQKVDAGMITLVDTLTNPNFPTGTGYSGAGQGFTAMPIIPVSFDRSALIEYRGNMESLGSLVDRGVEVRAAVRNFDLRMFKEVDDVSVSNWTTYNQGFQIMAAKGGVTILPDHPELWSAVEMNAMLYNTAITPHSVSRSDVKFLLPGQDQSGAFTLNLNEALQWQLSGSCWGNLESELLRLSQSSLTASQTSQRDFYVSPDRTGSIFDLSGGKGVAWETRITADLYAVNAAVPEPGTATLMTLGTLLVLTPKGFKVVKSWVKERSKGDDAN